MWNEGGILRARWNSLRRPVEFGCIVGKGRGPAASADAGHRGQDGMKGKRFGSDFVVHHRI